MPAYTSVHVIPDSIQIKIQNLTILHVQYVSFYVVLTSSSFVKIRYESKLCRKTQTVLSILRKCKKKTFIPFSLSNWTLYFFQKIII